MELCHWKETFAAGALMTAKAASTSHTVERTFAAQVGQAIRRDVPAAVLEIVVEAASEVPALLTRHSYDIALGARPATAAREGVENVPFLRYRRALIAAPFTPAGTGSRTCPRAGAS